MPLMARIGPGLLFAGAAIGTSHLVQSTRAGAVYGFGLFFILLAANLLKYPAFRFGPTYVAATGMSLVEGYRRLGKWAVILLSLSLILVHAIIIAATAITTAGIAGASLGLSFKATYFGVALIALAIILLFSGGYKLLDRLTKFFVGILTVATVAAALLVLPKIDWSLSLFALPQIDFKTFAFIVALMGFMPSAMDLSILQSLWCVAKNRTEGRTVNREDALFDFHLGYVCSILLALCFLIMGVGVMHTNQIAPESSSVAFAGQIISLYTESLGSWAGTVVGISAFGVMFTTLITIMDGFPRVHASAYLTLKNEDGRVHTRLDNTKMFRGTAIGLAIGASIILLLLMKNFLAFIDFITITAFIVGPIIAILNHLVITGQAVPAEHKPSKLMQIWSIVGIVTLSTVALAYLYMKIGM
jgi:Mn2+/Fe2+ NRAMP family transporter